MSLLLSGETVGGGSYYPTSDETNSVELKGHSVVVVYWEPSLYLEIVLR